MSYTRVHGGVGLPLAYVNSCSRAGELQRGQLRRLHDVRTTRNGNLFPVRSVMARRTLLARA